MNFKSLMLILACFSMTACAFKKDDVKQQEAAKTGAEVLQQHEQDQEQKKLAETEGGQLTDQNVSVNFIEMQEPGSYIMRINWPSTVISMEVQIDDEFETKTVRTNYFERAVIQGT